MGAPRQSRLHIGCQSVARYGEHMGLSGERYRYDSLPQHLLDELGMLADLQEYHCARVPEVLEPYLRQPGFL